MNTTNSNYCRIIAAVVSGLTSSLVNNQGNVVQVQLSSKLVLLMNSLLSILGEMLYQLKSSGIYKKLGSMGFMC
jgi:hypothetical protein